MLRRLIGALGVSIAVLGFTPLMCVMVVVGIVRGYDLTLDVLGWYFERVLEPVIDWTVND